MPWYGDDSPPQYEWAWLNRKLRPWPAPHGPRIDPRFRFNYGEYLPAPRPSQWFVRFRTEPAGFGPIRNGSLNLVAVSDTLLRGELPANAEGFSITWEAELFEDPVKEPNYGLSGIRYQLILHFAGFPDLYWRQFARAQLDGGEPFVTLRLRKLFRFIDHPFEYTNYDPAIFTYMTELFKPQMFEYFPLSECAVLEAAEEGFCECNGVDAWIKFTTWFPNGTSRFKWEYDIRPTATVSNIAIRGDSTNGAFFMGHANANNAVWWNRSVSLSPGLTVGVWQRVRMEHDWSIAGDFYTVWIDDVQVGQNAGTFTPSWFDQIGKVGGAFRGQFDLRNIVHTSGSPGTPLVILDFPLTVDACPVVGAPIKGTTFNMALPSCP